MALLEKNSGAVSDYLVSRQLTASLELVTIRKLLVKPETDGELKPRFAAVQIAVDVRHLQGDDYRQFDIYDNAPSGRTRYQQSQWPVGYQFILCEGPRNQKLQKWVNDGHCLGSELMMQQQPQSQRCNSAATFLSRGQAAQVAGTTFTCN